jgi:hypothetical protein
MDREEGEPPGSPSCKKRGEKKREKMMKLKGKGKKNKEKEEKRS